MELLADRFLLTDRDHALDLSTGARVRVVTTMQGGVTDQARWAARCARLASLRHPSLSVLLDYGAVGEARRFEAWSGGDDARVGREASAAAEQAAACLGASGLHSGQGGAAVLDGGAIVIVPDAAAGYGVGDVAGAGLAPLASYGIALIPRPSLEVVAEWLGHAAPYARAMSVWGAAGAGIDTVLLQIARLARLQGLVPLCPRAATDDVRRSLRGRSVLVMARDHAEDGWRLFLDLSVQSRRRHLLLCAGAADLKGMVPLVLERLSPEALAAAVRPCPTDSVVVRRVAAAAAESNGLPGTFAARLWKSVNRPCLHVVPSLSRVAEPAADYGSVIGRLPAGRPASWSSPVEVRELQQARQDAECDVAAGRSARGERRLRQVIGGLTRRHEWADAAGASLALAEALIRRGRGGDAASILDCAGDYARQSNEVTVMLRTAVAAGLQALDQQRLDEAEAVLGAARATARASGDRSAMSAALRALARVLAWRGRFDEGHDVLSQCAQEPESPEARVEDAALRSCLALGRGCYADAIMHASRAVAVAAQESARLRAVAWATSAQAHLAVGDRAAVARDVQEVVSHARSAHDPLCALGARLTAAESERRAGSSAEAARLVARLTRPGGPQLPPLVGARVQLLSALLKDDRPETTTRLIKSTGLGALALFAPAPVCVPAVSSLVVSSVLEILRCTQSADDDLRMLERLCAQVRTATRALAVGVFADERCQLTLVSSVGSRLDSVEATHVQRVDATIGPRAGVATSSYGGAPIRWGGQTIGVLQVCWPGRDGVSAGDCDPILSAAVVAMAPVLAAERARRARPSGPVAELLGSSDAMAQVRAAVERAASAPFAVLIEGESGSGKELVARALHKRSPRRDRGCCSVNCAALPDDLLESELFGHARGAFTGAMAERVGVFEEAHGGTLFLDEVGELSARAQAKLLRAIQEGEIRRVGENTPRRVDVRIVAATNRRLHEEVRAGRFRQDLLYRLDVIRIALPPLRDRAEDVALLAEHFWRDAAARVSSRATLSVATLAALARYDWPGNVRELQNVLASLVVRVPARGVVMPSSLPAAFHTAVSAEGCRLDMAKRRFEAAFVRGALARAGGHRTKAAEELGVTRQGLTKLMTRLGLDAAKQHDMPQSSPL